MTKHWYTYLFLILGISCFIKAAFYANKNNSAKVIWFIFMIIIWLGLTYWTSLPIMIGS